MKTDAGRSRKVAFKTLGCKLNQAETESIASGFKRLGWTVVEFGQQADAIVINSCTVTDTADRKSRQALNRALRSVDTSRTLVVMTGCYADGYRNVQEVDNRVYVVGNQQKNRIPQLVEARYDGKKSPDAFTPDTDVFGYSTLEKTFRTRAMVKVQDGCDNYCTYCIIPYVRGRAMSRPIRLIAESIRDAVIAGYREIVLTGVNMSRWKNDSKSFMDMLQTCLDVEGDFRLRLGSIEPDRINNDLADLMRHPKMTPHLHLCLQSGSERILRRMRRQYTVAQYVSMAEELGKAIPQFNLTTDIIVGFPGETDDDFADTIAICEHLNFGHIHTFPYSRRQGTPACDMDNQMSPKVKKERADIIRNISRKKKRTFRETLIGTTQEILVEKSGYDNGRLMARGLSACYVPTQFELTDFLDSDKVVNRIFQVGIHCVAQGDDPDLIGLLNRL